MSVTLQDKGVLIAR